MTRLRSICSLSVIIVLFLTGCAGSDARPETAQALRHIEPDEATATSKAVVVEDVALTHTDQFYAVDQNGNFVGAGDLDAQVRQVIENIRISLQLVGSGLEDVAKLNVYLAESVSVDDVTALLPGVLPSGSRPAISFVSIEVPSPNALVAMDAVAVGPKSNAPPTTSFHQSDSLHASGDQAHVGILPAGPKVYLAGQARRGELLEGVAGTMVSLHATLAYLGLSAEDVVQVKAFVNPMTEAAAIEEKIGEYYRNRPGPPVVVTEWRQDNFPAEIELIAKSKPMSSDEGESISYVTPPGMSSASTFSRVASINDGRQIFVSGLYGAAGQEDEAQVRAIFEELDRVLALAGGDFDHLVKATYYISTEGASGALNDVRRELFDPQRPPAASKIHVRNVGAEGSTVTLDMVGIVAE